MAGISRFASIPFNARMTEDVSPKSLNPPNFIRIENLRYLKDGSLTSKKALSRLANLPSPESISDESLKLFTHSDQLSLIGKQGIYSLDEEQKKWARLSQREQIDLNIHQISQKEGDLQYPAAVKWGNNLYIFYFFKNNLYYKIFNTYNKRVSGPERVILSESEEKLGMAVIRDVSSIWIAFSLPTKIRFLKLNPLTSLSIEEESELAKENVRRFQLLDNTLFFVNESGVFESHIFNPSGNDPLTPLTLNDIPDPASNATRYSGDILYDFYEWSKFTRGTREWKLLWSVQTGFFIINDLDQLIAHSHTNFTPFDNAEPYRMSHMGNAIEDGDKVYIPILRSGQAEVVEGREIIYALGLELFEIDLSPKFPSQTVQISSQMLISGAINSYFNGQEIVELGFTEKPLIQKTPTDDYDKWPYDALGQRLPTFAELTADQYVQWPQEMVRADTPYMVTTLTAVAEDESGNIVLQTFSGNASDRQLRYSTSVSTGGVGEAYGTNGALTKVTYDTTENALIVDFSSPPSALESEKEHPGGILINNKLYEFMYTRVVGGVLKGYYFTEFSPLIEGRTYEVSIPHSQTASSGDISQEIQAAEDANSNTAINITSLKLSQFNTVRVGSGVIQSIALGDTKQIAFENTLKSTEVTRQIPKQTDYELRFGLLQAVGDKGYLERGFRDRLDYPMEFSNGAGSLSEGLRSLENISITSIWNNSDLPQEVDLGSEHTGRWHGVFKIGNRVWFLEASTTTGGARGAWARGYTYNNRGSLTRTSGLDQLISSTGIYSGAIVVGNSVFFLHTGDARFVGYTYSNGRFRRDTSKDMPFGIRGVSGGFSQGNNVWTVWNNQSNSARALGWTVSNGRLRRNTSADFDISHGAGGPGGPSGAFSVGNNAWVILRTGAILGLTINGARLTRNSSLDSAFGAGDYEGAVVIDNLVWAVDNRRDRGVLFTYDNGNFTRGSDRFFIGDSLVVSFSGSTNIFTSKANFLSSLRTVVRSLTFSISGLSSYTLSLSSLSNPSSANQIEEDGFYSAKFSVNVSSTLRRILQRAIQDDAQIDLRANYFEPETSTIRDGSGFIKDGYGPRIGLPSDHETGGSITNEDITSSLEVTALWNDSRNDAVGGNLYLAISSALADYASFTAMKESFSTQVDELIFLIAGQTFRISQRNLPAPREILSGGVRSLVYNLSSSLASSSILRSLITSAIGGSSLSVQFKTPVMTVYSEEQEGIFPDIFGVTFESNNELRSTDLKNAIFALRTLSSQERNVYYIPSFTQIKGAENEKFYYYKRTEDSPITALPYLFAFFELPLTIYFRYVIVDAVLEPSATEILLRATAYKYKCRFKWVDQLGIEHRSQFSDEIEILARSPIGEEGNRPTFEVSNLNLTNKADESLSIEIYRTENLLNTFYFLKEIPNDRTLNRTVFRDDVLDEDLGVAAGPNNIPISGAKYVEYYKSRYVLYGFPEKPSRIIISSPIRTFTNEAIDFRREGSPFDMIEILMESEVTCIRVMDQYIVIYTKQGTFVWAVNEASAQQNYPTEVTGMVNLSARSARGASMVEEGIMFLSEKGIWMITRGTQGVFIGKDVQDFKGDIIDIQNLDNENETRILTDSDTHPQLVYNYRFKRWSIFSESNFISSVVWKNKFLSLTSDRKIYEEIEDAPVVQNFSFETGWIHLGDIQNFQRFREIFLLADLKNPVSLSMSFAYDFLNVNRETINYDFSRYSQAISGQLPGNLQISRDDIKQFRFQPRQQKCTSVKILCRIQAESCSLDGLRIGYNVLPGSYIQSRRL